MGATNPIGKNTANVSVNLLKAEQKILGRLALNEDRSLGEFIRRMVVIGLRVTHSDAALEMEIARKKHNAALISQIK